MSIVVPMTSDAERQRGFIAAKAALLRGECVVIPTDTVYGIAANPFAPNGISNLMAAKQRDRDLAIPVFVPNLDSAFALSYNLSEQAKLLMRKFWPGALTVVAAAHPTLKWDLDNGDGTVALRIPLQRTALELLNETGPLAVSAASLGTSAAATSIDVAQRELGKSVAVYLDAGQTAGELPSTIIDTTKPKLRLVRAGAIAVSAIVEVVGATELLED